MNMGENVPLDEKRKQEKTGLMEGGRIGGGEGGEGHMGV